MAHREPLELYYSKTRDLPPPERIAGFLSCVPQDATLLDFGTGTGRYAAAFHRDRPDLIIDVLDQYLEMASCLEGADWVRARLHMGFEEFSAENTYDVIWSNASLFFYPPEQLPTLLLALHKALKPRGLLWFTFLDDVPQCSAIPFVWGMTREKLEDLLENSGFAVEKIVQREDMRYGETLTAIATHIIHARKTA